MFTPLNRNQTLRLSRGDQVSLTQRFCIIVGSHDAFYFSLAHLPPHFLIIQGFKTK